MPRPTRELDLQSFVSLCVESPGAGHRGDREKHMSGKRNLELVSFSTPCPFCVEKRIYFPSHFPFCIFQATCELSQPRGWWSSGICCQASASLSHSMEVRQGLGTSVCSPRTLSSQTSMQSHFSLGLPYFSQALLEESLEDRAVKNLHGS